MRLTTVTVTDDGDLRVDAPYHAEIVARLKAVGGRWEPAARVWIVPAAQGDRLLDALWRASYSPDALDLCHEAAARRTAHFVNGLARLGIVLRVTDGGAVVADGNVSPVIVEAVTERAEAVRAWLEHNEPWQAAGRRRVDYAVVPTALEAAIVDGMHNAAEKRAKAQAIQARVTRRRMLEQMELWDSRETSATTLEVDYADGP